MKNIYCGGAVVETGDAIAEAVLRYATALSTRGRHGVVRVPTSDSLGQVAEAVLLLGPGVGLALLVAPWDELEPEDPALVDSLNDAANRLLGTDHVPARSAVCTTFKHSSERGRGSASNS